MSDGPVCRVEPERFLELLQQHKPALVLQSIGGVVRVEYRYLATIDGITFFTSSREAMSLPAECELVKSTKLWIPCVVNLQQLR